MINIRSGFMIHVQVESVKHCKTEGSGYRRKLLSIIKNKENLDLLVEKDSIQYL